ncbi:MAG: erythromycin esterase family protein [Gammaproteobacteria bacterium]|nr:erythromycin esterase family protein [Gammaproteobacteria bacterium]
MQLGTASFGSRAFRVLGDDYVVIASLTRCETCEIDRSGSLEDALHARFGEETAIVNLSAAGDLEETVTTPGTAYAQNHNMLFRNLVLSEQFDAVVYFPGSGLTVERN